MKVKVQSHVYRGGNRGEMDLDFKELVRTVRECIFYVNCFLLFGQIVFCEMRKNREFYLDFWVGKEGRVTAL